jgi:hypothetical protein
MQLLQQTPMHALIASNTLPNPRNYAALAQINETSVSSTKHNKHCKSNVTDSYLCNDGHTRQLSNVKRHVSDVTADLVLQLPQGMVCTAVVLTLLVTHLQLQVAAAFEVVG